MQRTGKEHYIGHDAHGDKDVQNVVPGANVLSRIERWPSVAGQKFHGINADFNDVVDKGEGGGERQGSRKQGYIAELDDHFLIIEENTRVLGVKELDLFSRRRSGFTAFFSQLLRSTIGMELLLDSRHTDFKQLLKNQLGSEYKSKCFHHCVSASFCRARHGI